VPLLPHRNKDFWCSQCSITVVNVVRYCLLHVPWSTDAVKRRNQRTAPLPSSQHLQSSTIHFRNISSVKTVAPLRAWGPKSKSKPRVCMVYGPNPTSGTHIAVFSILADRSENNLQSAEVLIGRELVSGPMDGCRASVHHNCSRRDRPKLGRLQY